MNTCTNDKKTLFNLKIHVHFTSFYIPFCSFFFIFSLLFASNKITQLNTLQKRVVKVPKYIPIGGSFRASLSLLSNTTDQVRS